MLSSLDFLGGGSPGREMVWGEASLQSTEQEEVLAPTVSWLSARPPRAAACELAICSQLSRKEAFSSPTTTESTEEPRTCAGGSQPSPPSVQGSPKAAETGKWEESTAPDSASCGPLTKPQLGNRRRGRPPEEGGPVGLRDFAQ